MKINLPSDVINECMERSPKFRNYVADLLSNINNITKREIEDVFVTFARTGMKIQAIKDLREYSRDNQDRLDAIKNFYPSQYQSSDGVLTLASAKSIVDLY